MNIKETSQTTSGILQAKEASEQKAAQIDDAVSTLTLHHMKPNACRSNNRGDSS